MNTSTRAPPRPERLPYSRGVIDGAHVIVYSRDAAADRAFFRNVLGFGSVDAGGGWLIFELPPAELAMHPAETGGGHELYLMCDDVHRTVEELSAGRRDRP